MVSEDLKDDPSITLASFQSRNVAAQWTLFFWIIAVPLLSFGLRIAAVADLIHPWQGFLIVFGLPSVAYLMVGASHRATAGMRIQRIVFARVHGDTISFAQAFVRLSIGLLLIPLLPISIIIKYCDRYGRSLADLICGTAVWQLPMPQKRERRGFEVIPLEERQS
jgi:uncharacterized RDD family membrane protein YckC